MDYACASASHQCEEIANRLMILNKKTKFLKTLKFFPELSLFLVLIILSGCGSENPTQQVKPPAEAVPVVPDRSAPVVNVSQVTEETRQTYQWYCTQCHGEKGHGNGVNAPHLVVPPRDHTKASYLETRSDEQLFEAIKLGGLAVGRAPCMPAWGNTLEDKTIHSLVSYIRELCDCEAL